MKTLTTLLLSCWLVPHYWFSWYRVGFTWHRVTHVTYTQVCR